MHTPSVYSFIHSIVNDCLFCGKHRKSREQYKQNFNITEAYILVEETGNKYTPHRIKCYGKILSSDIWLCKNNVVWELVTLLGGNGRHH